MGRKRHTPEQIIVKLREVTRPGSARAPREEAPTDRERP
jgi:hypothetical protein